MCGLVPKQKQRIGEGYPAMSQQNSDSPPIGGLQFTHDSTLPPLSAMSQDVDRNNPNGAIPHGNELAWDGLPFLPLTPDGLFGLPGTGGMHDAAVSAVGDEPVGIPSKSPPQTAASYPLDVSGGRCQKLGPAAEGPFHNALIATGSNAVCGEQVHHNESMESFDVDEFLRELGIGPDAAGSSAEKPLNGPNKYPSGGEMSDFAKENVDPLSIGCDAMITENRQYGEGVQDRDPGNPRTLHGKSEDIQSSAFVSDWASTPEAQAGSMLLLPEGTETNGAEAWEPAGTNGEFCGGTTKEPFLISKSNDTNHETPMLPCMQGVGDARVDLNGDDQVDTDPVNAAADLDMFLQQMDYLLAGVDLDQALRGMEQGIRDGEGYLD
jgi:hypothetical protein